MSLALIVGLALFSPIFWWLVPFRYRIHFLLIVSIFLLYGLQSAPDLPHLTFVFPTTLVVMVIGVGLLIRPEALPKHWYWSVPCLAIIVWIVPSASPVTALAKQIVSMGVGPALSGILSLTVLLGSVGISLAPFLRKIPMSAILVAFGLIAFVARVIAPEIFPSTASPLERQAALLLVVPLLLGVIPFAIPARIAVKGRSLTALI